MIENLLCPGLLETGPVSDTLMAVRDGLVNFYILKAPAGLVCIDAGWRPATVNHGFEMPGRNIKDVVAVFVTHLHWDHARCLSLFAHAEIFAGDHEQPAFFMKKHTDAQTLIRVRGNQTISVAGITVRVIETPGHTSGSVSYVVDNHLLFTGDTLRLKAGKALPFLHWFNEDEQILRQSIQRLAGIEGLDCLLTAHNGITMDVRGAFDQWGQSNDKSLRRGVGS